MRVLHLLSQRPSHTGSGVTLEALVREADRAGWEQAVIVGTPIDDPNPRVEPLAEERVHPLRFGEGGLAFPLPGMSDVMPYPSSRFSSLGAKELEAYRAAWRDHVAAVVARFSPDVIHSHHVWLLSSLLKDVVPEVPVVTQSHATGFRQMGLCPHLKEEVRYGCARNDRILVLTRGHARQAELELHLSPDRVEVVGAGYRDELFHAESTEPRRGVLYVGKYSDAKGLPWLLDAFERLADSDETSTLHIAGSGAGREAEALRARMEALAPRVVLHGQIPQDELAVLMRRCALFILPSFYEGLPLVVVEALACGCRVVCTDLPAVREELAPHLGALVDLVPLPRLRGADQPEPEDLPRFVDDLERAIRHALARPPLADPAGILAPFTWGAVFERVQHVWRQVI